MLVILLFLFFVVRPVVLADFNFADFMYKEVRFKTLKNADPAKEGHAVHEDCGRDDFFAESLHLIRKLVKLQPFFYIVPKFFF